MINFFTELFTTSHGLVAIIFSLLTACYPLYAKKKYGSESIQSGAVSLGILGTFLGVALGLATFAFDKDSIDKSIELLIGGLKVAFITPIIGLVVSLLVKHTNLYNIKEEVEDKSEKDILVQLLKAIESNSESINRMSNSISGDGDSTLYTQIQKLRTGMLDKQEELNIAFKNFAEKMAEDNASTFIKALEKAMQEFNDNLTKTVGANFVRLNEGIENMLVWQDKYKDQIETSNNQLGTIKKSLDVSESVMSKVTEQARTFANISEKLESTLASMYETQIRVEGGLLSFDKVSKDAKDNFSMVHEGFEKLKESFTEVVEGVIKHNNDHVRDLLDSATQNTVSLNKKLTESISASVEESAAALRKMVNDTVKESSESLRLSKIEITNKNIELGDLLSTRMSGFEKQMERLISDSIEVISSHTKNTDEALRKELDNSMKTLGGQFTAITTAMVNDYSNFKNEFIDMIRMKK